MIIYKCANCRSELENPRSMAGQLDTCPVCGREHTVPRPRSRLPLILIGGGVVALGLIAVAVIPHLWRSEPQQLQEDSSGQPSSKVTSAIADSKLAKKPQTAADSPKQADSAKQEDERKALEELLKKAEKSSQNVEEAICATFIALVGVQASPPSSNPFVEQRRKEDLANARARFSKMISEVISQEPCVVFGWSFFANKVQQDGSGQVTLTGSFQIVTKDGHVLGLLEGVFRVANQKCLEKVKALETPCFVYVYGTGRGEFNEPVDGMFYTLKFDLDDVRPIFTPPQVSKP